MKHVRNKARCITAGKQRGESIKHQYDTTVASVSPLSYSAQDAEIMAAVQEAQEEFDGPEDGDPMTMFDCSRNYEEIV